MNFARLAGLEACTTPYSDGMAEAFIPVGDGTVIGTVRRLK
jgi:hypothetical protein